MRNPIRLDDVELAAFEAELKFVQARTIEVPHKALKALTILPVNADAPSGTKTIAYRYYDSVGVAKIVMDYATDFPRVDAYGEEKIARVRGVGDSYGYTIPEIRSSQLTRNGRLDTQRAKLAKKRCEELIDKLAWHGDAKYGIQGLFDYPGTTELTVSNGASGHKTWATKTGHEMVQDIVDGATGIQEATNGLENPDTLILPIAQYNLLATTPMGPEGFKTALTYLKECLPNLTRIESVVDLKGAGDSSLDRFMLFERTPEKLDFQMPQIFEQFPPQQIGLEYVVYCHAEIGGVIVYFPQSVAYGDGI